MRGLWVRYGSLENPDAIRKLVATAATAGFNTLFTQTRPDGDSRPLSFDPLSELITQAHAAGLTVHAWVDVTLVSRVGEVQASRDHVVYAHPEWLMVPRDIAAELLSSDAHAPDYLGRLSRWTRTHADRVDGLYVSPLQSDAAAHMADEVRDLVRRYAFDGVYLDHVRFPADDYDYGARSIAAVRDWVRGQVELDRRRLADGQQDIDPFAYPNTFATEWRTFRRTQLTMLLARIRSVVQSARPKAIVAAALADVDVRRADAERLVDWRTWMDGGFIDAVGPLVSGDLTGPASVELSRLLAVAGAQPVWVTIGASRLSQRQTLDDIQAARRLGARGIILFSYDALVTPPRGLDYLSSIGRSAFSGL
jgi:uncharacterized lipoprotein YddW (UPF0748 family)